LWVEYFLKMHIAVSFMLLHISSHSFNTKSTSFKSDFNNLDKKSGQKKWYCTNFLLLITWFVISKWFELKSGNYTFILTYNLRWNYLLRSANQHISQDKKAKTLESKTIGVEGLKIVQTFLQIRICEKISGNVRTYIFRWHCE
jgi:hypothetical protein